MKTKLFVILCCTLLNVFVFAQVKTKKDDTRKIVKHEKILTLRPAAGEKYSSPKWSPDAKMLAFSNQALNVIYLYSFKTKKVDVLVKEEGVGYKFQWSADGRFISYRGTIGSGKTRKQYLAYIDVTSKNINKVGLEKSSYQPPWWHYEGDAIYMAYLDDNQIKHERVSKIAQNFINKLQNITAVFMNNTLYFTDGYSLSKLTDENSFDPVFSPDKSSLFYSSLSGLFLYRINKNETVKIGNYRSASWSPDGKYAVLQSSSDDGHVITGSELLLFDIEKKLQIPITEPKNELEENPDLSACGTKICFNTMLTGEIVVIKIENN